MLLINRNTHRVMALVASLCAAFAHAQPATDQSKAAAARVFTIGVAAPLTGVIAHLGKAISQGVTLAVESANAGAPANAERGFRFAITEQDDGGDPKRAIAVATALAGRDVSAIVGHLNSGISIPASKVYADRNIAMVTPASSNPALTEQGLSNVFRIVARDDLQPTALYALAQREGLKRIAVLTERSVYGAIIGRAALMQAESSSLRLTLSEVALTEDTIATRDVGERIANLELDAVVVVGSDNFLKILLKAFDKAKAKPLRLLATDYACTDDLLKLPVAPHRVTCSSPDPDLSIIDEKFTRAYHARFGEAPHPYAATAFDAASVIIAAARAANSSNPADVARQVLLTSHVGATGNITFDKRGDRIGAPILLSEVVDGKSQLKYLFAGGGLRAAR